MKSLVQFINEAQHTTVKMTWPKLLCTIYNTSWGGPDAGLEDITKGMLETAYKDGCFAVTPFMKDEKELLKYLLEKSTDNKTKLEVMKYTDSDGFSREKVFIFEFDDEKGSWKFEAVGKKLVGPKK